MGLKTKYKDTGCELHPTCLDCPVPTDECPLSLGGTAHSLKEKRDASIRKLYQEGKSTKELAELFKVSRRTIKRVLILRGGNLNAQT